MSGKILLTCLCVLGMLHASAHNTPQVIAQSEPFEEPESGASRLLLMPTGRTLFFHFTPSDGIDVTVYGTDHRQRTVTHSDIRSWKNRRMRFAQLRGLYEINGQAVVFLEQYLGMQPLLYRFIFDGVSGSLLSEKLIASLPSTHGLYGRSTAIRNDQHATEFTVRKDPGSNAYAVAISDLYTWNPARQIRVQHYNGQHELLSEAPFDPPDNSLENIDIADMYVQGDTSVFVAAFAFDRNIAQIKDSRLIIGTLPRGGKAFQTTRLEHTARLQMRDVAMKYLPQNGLLYLLTSNQERLFQYEPMAIMRRGYERYSLLMTVIDPRTLSERQHYFVEHPVLDKYAKERLHYRKPYYGVIQDFHVHGDGTTQLLFEELEVTQEPDATFTHTDSEGRIYTTAAGKHYVSRLGGIGVALLDTTGKETAGYAIAKDQVTKADIDLFHIQHRNQAGWTFRSNNEWLNLSGFYSYDFFHADGKDYIFYNDVVDNTEDKQEDYRSKDRVFVISRTQTVCAVYENGQITKTYLYGAPETNTNRFSQLETTARSKDGKSFATMMIERTRQKKEARIVWVTL